MVSSIVVVITDANVLINFYYIGRLDLLGRLKPYRFRIPFEVLREITDPDQFAAVETAIASGHLETLAIDSLEALALFAELREVMGNGEAACLAAAATNGVYIASDERKRFRRKAIELLGEGRILRTEDLLLYAIREELVSIGQCDGFKAELAAHRYVMPFDSFAEKI
ncbi:MAG TPA: hypothetical protein VM532_09075 [Burkholderiales bacterium]|jgi:predicted nucleic acid-binding protein|nr:hypothetical protein [Burkholderiales bacterium]